MRETMLKLSLSGDDMIRCLMLLLSCIVFTACSSVFECESISIKLADKYESQLFIDKANDRQGFFNLAQKLQSNFGTDKDVYSLLIDEKLSMEEKNKIFDEFGPLLLMMAISKADKDIVAFYLHSGVDSLSYHSHVGVLILDLLDVNDREIFSEFKYFFQENQINSDAFDEVDKFYDECVL